MNEWRLEGRRAESGSFRKEWYVLPTLNMFHFFCVRFSDTLRCPGCILSFSPGLMESAGVCCRDSCIRTEQTENVLLQIVFL